ncbi:serine protease [Amycolatopsis antarctica]|uniref:Serine protease n=1 Tax=Amycolatopsis antarctica TaxID=1854586 RepID=A0A263D9I6_9PSEU|nr:S8 family serine peptidase [Amycolatopsis antarctica]OZM74207.1 serine protease [Amycolatopsis antarctica]
MPARSRTLALLALCAIAPVLLAPPAHADPGEQVDPPSWGLDRVDQRAGGDGRYRYETTAETVTVYVLGTGVAAGAPDLAGRVQPGKDLVDGDDDAADGNGNGTLLASIVGGERFGIAKDVRIVPVRVLDDTGAGSIDNVIAGVDWVRENAEQPAVALFSLGGSASEPLDAAVRQLAETVPVVVPAGNSATDASEVSPARVPQALTVAASDSADGASGTSNYGPAVDLYAPGVDVTGEGLGGEAVTFSGSTAAAAHVAGGVALYRALHPQASGADSAAAVVSAATEGALSGVPAGTADRLLYTLTP